MATHRRPGMWEAKLGRFSDSFLLISRIREKIRSILESFSIAVAQHDEVRSMLRLKGTNFWGFLRDAWSSFHSSPKAAVPVDRTSS